jgi:uncharacterized protein YkwD
MRKPLVVVGLATTAVLLAGGIAATAANAEETPDMPGIPGFSFADLPGFSFFGNSDDDVGDDAGDDSADAGDQDRDVQDQDTQDQASQDQDAQDQASQDQDAQDQDTQDQGDGDAAQAAAQNHAARPGGAARPDAAGQLDDKTSTDTRQPAVQAQRQQAAAQHPQVSVKQRPALTQQAAGGQASGGQAAGAGLMATARQQVTSADVSTSPTARVQQQVLTLINQNRRQHGCGSLSLDRRLIDAANEHAQDMARHDYFAHQSRNGDGAGDRVRDNGYRWRRYGENIARGADSAYEVVDGWMHSPEHRHNILDCRLNQMGIGLAISRDRERTPYWVQDFATPQ